MQSFIEEIKAGTRPPLARFVAELGDTFELLNSLAETEQDPVWHGEGDVFVHTEMVLGELYEQLDGADVDLSEDDQLALILGAVFHDIAKPLTTRRQLIKGRECVVAPHHADRGRSYLAYKILELGLSPEVAHKVLAIVGHHHDPKRLVLKDRGPAAYRRLARLADVRLLYLLEIADMRGRHCPDLDEQLGHLELFRLYAEDYGVWQGDPFAPWRAHIDEQLASFDEDYRALVYGQGLLDADRGQIFTPEEAIARAYRQRDGYSHLVVMCGPSGSGKSAFIERHLAAHEVVSLDALREELTGDAADQRHNGQVLHLARERLREHLRAHRPVVWDATGLRRDFRRMPAGLGFDYGALVDLVVFQLSERDLFARNAARTRSVPHTVLERQIAGLEFPYADEAHRIVSVY